MRKLLSAYARYQPYERQTYCRLNYEDGVCFDFAEAEALHDVLSQLFERLSPSHFGGLGSIEVAHDGETIRTRAFTQRGPIDLPEPSVLREMAEALLDHAARLHAAEVGRIYYSQFPGHQPRYQGLATDASTAAALITVVLSVSSATFERCPLSDYVALLDGGGVSVQVRNMGHSRLIKEPELSQTAEVYQTLLAATVQKS